MSEEVAKQVETTETEKTVEETTKEVTEENEEKPTSSSEEPKEQEESTPSDQPVAASGTSSVASDTEDAKPESEQQPQQEEKPESEQIEEEPEPEPIVIPHGNGERVLVTGASGYLASHILKALLETGEFKVRGSVRNLETNPKVEALKTLVENPKYDLELVEADLTNAESWIEAAKDCEYVIHTASPFPLTEPDNENDLIEPAKEGTLSILKACVEAKSVKRVVITSSVKSISAGLPADKSSINEDKWADIQKPIGAYEKSKVLAEKAAWDFVAELPEEQKFELAVVNPGFIMGPPLLAAAESSSIEVVKKMMNREYPTLPKLSYPIVDVRDVALAHVRAMLIKQASGKRIMVTGPNASMQEIGKILSAEFDKQGFNVPTSQAPYVLVWLKSRFDKDLKRILPDVGKVYHYDTKRMKEVLLIEPRDYNVTLTEMGHALIDLGIVKKVEKKEKKMTMKKKKSVKEEEGEEKKDEPEKIEDVSGSGSAASETAKVDDVEVTVAENEKNAEPAAEETETAAEITEEEGKVEAAVASEEQSGDDAKEEATGSSEETSPKKKDKKEKKEKKEKKKKSIFSSLSFKRNKKPAAEKKDEEKKGDEAAGTEAETAPAPEAAAAATTEGETAAAATTEGETAAAAATEGEADDVAKESADTAEEPAKSEDEPKAETTEEATPTPEPATEAEPKSEEPAETTEATESS